MRNQRETWKPWNEEQQRTWLLRENNSCYTREKMLKKKVLKGTSTSETNVTSEIRRRRAAVSSNVNITSSEHSQAETPTNNAPALESNLKEWKYFIKNAYGKCFQFIFSPLLIRPPQPPSWLPSRHICMNILIYQEKLYFRITNYWNMFHFIILQYILCASNKKHGRSQGR